MEDDATPVNIPIEILRSFVLICDTGDLPRVAQRLRLTDAGLSAQLRRLGRVARGPILVRSKGRLVLTELGRKLQAYARRIVAMNDQIVSATGAHPAQRRIGIPRVFASAFLPLIHSLCAEANAGRPPIISCDLSDRLATALQNGFIDIAIMVGQNHLSTTTDVVWNEPLGWACARNLLPEPGRPIPVISSVNNSIDRMALNTITKTGLQHRITLTAADWSTKLSAASVGIGYLITPRRAIPAALKCAEDLHITPVPDLLAAIHVRSEDTRHRDIRALIEVLAQIFLPAPNLPLGMGPQ
jgi:DNA-binding transcriptional LysR family regulator